LKLKTSLVRVICKVTWLGGKKDQSVSA
jgi:hypothetical protein